MRHPTTVLLAAALLAAATGCARDTTPQEPTVANATRACTDHLRQATGQDTVVDTTTPEDEHVWTITGRAGDRTFTCRVAYTYSVEGVRTDLYYETDPPLDADPTTT